MSEVKESQLAAKSVKFEADPAFLRKHPQATTLAPRNPAVPGSPLVTVTFGAAYTAQIEGTQERPPESRQIPAATQAQLEYLYNQGNPHVIIAE